MSIEELLNIHGMRSVDLSENEMIEIKNFLLKFNNAIEDLNKSLLDIENDSAIKVSLSQALELLGEDNV